MTFKKDSRCIDCFFAMRQRLLDKQNWFKEQFGFAPIFKAGIHFGKVTTGEIGVIKKEILFSGDGLNATLRIQRLCNSYDVDLIISDQLMQRLQIPEKYQRAFLGESELRGKKENIGLHTLKLLKDV